MTNMCFMDTQWSQERERGDSMWQRIWAGSTPEILRVYMVCAARRPRWGSRRKFGSVVCFYQRTQLLGNDQKQRDEEGSEAGGESQMDGSELLPNTSLLASFACWSGSRCFISFRTSKNSLFSLFISSNLTEINPNMFVLVWFSLNIPFSVYFVS